jgi:hypothetical protein
MKTNLTPEQIAVREMVWRAAQEELQLMKTNLTVAQIEARRKVWHASQVGEGVTLTPPEVKELWESILQTGIELMDLREELTNLALTVARGKA